MSGLDNNPVYKACAPKMRDGRAFTDYRPVCTTENLIQLQNGIKNSYDYRLFLQENAESIMDFNRAYAIKKNGCEPCNAPKVIWSEQTPLRPKTPWG